METQFQNLPPSSPGYELVFEERCMNNATNMLGRLQCAGDSTVFVLFLALVGVLFLEYLYFHKRRKKAKHHLHHTHRK